MFRLMLAVVACLALLTVSSDAQTIVRTVDLSALGWGAIDATPVDTDGIPETEEWVVFSPGRHQWRVVAIRDTICAGEWFSVGRTLFAQANIVRIGRVDVLRVREPFTPEIMTIVALSTPACGT